MKFLIFISGFVLASLLFYLFLNGSIGKLIYFFEKLFEND